MEKESCILNQEFVNKFADFLSNEISENNTYKTKLSVVDCQSFFIIKGFTLNKNISVLSSLTEKFIENEKDNYSDLNDLNLKTLDIIDYDTDHKNFDIDTIFINYSTNTPTSTTPKITLQSEFPYGYSENYLKQTYNHLKEITCKAQPYFKFSWAKLTCKLTKTDFEITSIESDSYYKSEKLLSILKDNYDGPIDVLLDESKIFLNVI